MGSGIEAITSAAIAVGLDAAMLRQKAIATNIANANTEGYTPLRVNFASQVSDAIRTLNEAGKIDMDSLQAIRPFMEADMNVQPGSIISSAVSLDEQAAQLAQNGIHYQTLIKGLNSHYAILSYAVGDGKK